MNRKILTGVIIIVVIIGALLAVLKFTGQEQKEPKIDYFITVSEPVAEQSADSPIVIKGQALVPDDIVGYRLFDDNGKILAEGLTVAKSQNLQAGNFKLNISYPQPETDKGKLEIFARAADESNNYLTSIPLVFPKVEFEEISVFFSNAMEDPQTMYCEKTYPDSRRITTADRSEEDLAKLAVELLLTGPTLADISAGFFSNINTGVNIISLDITDRTAVIDFDENIAFQVGGSCRVSAIRSQIENTLKQFDFIDNVIIMVNGNSEEALQP